MECAAILCIIRNTWLDLSIFYRDMEDTMSSSGGYRSTEEIKYKHREEDYLNKITLPTKKFRKHTIFPTILVY